jgi:hypothetical protein
MRCFKERKLINNKKIASWGWREGALHLNRKVPI